MVQKNGERIGIIGATTPNLRFISSPRNVHIISDMAGEIQSEVNQLEASGVNKIVLISHLQDLDADMALVGQLNGVDVVVAGGGNELLANGGDLLVPGYEEPYGPYAIIATDLKGTEVPVVTTTGRYGYLGKLVVHFDGEGNVAEIDKEASGLIRIAGGENPDAMDSNRQVQEMLVDPVLEFRDDRVQPIAISQVDLEGRRSEVRSRETNLGNLMADSLLWQAQRVAVDYGAAPPDVALQNGGAIRNGIPAGPVRLLDTFDMAPFSNLVTVLENISRMQSAPCVVLEADDINARLLAQALNRIQGEDDLGVKAAVAGGPAAGPRHRVVGPVTRDGPEPAGPGRPGPGGHRRLPSVMAAGPKRPAQAFDLPGPSSSCR